MSDAPRFARAALHVGGLWALAVVQPLFALLGDNAAFFVARGNTAGDILALALGFGLLPPLVLAAAVAAVGRARPRLGRALLAVAIGLLAALLVLAPAGRALPAGVALALALAAGTAFAALYVRGRFARALLTTLSPAPVVVVGLFLLASPVAELVLPASAAAARGPERSDTPIVMVVLDELPLSTLTDARGRLDRRRFPHIAGLARDATWYRNATTVADFTTEAVPAQLTGERVPAGSLPTDREHPRNLFTLFARSHDMLVDEPITDLCPRRLCEERREAQGDRLASLVSDLSVVEGHLLLPRGLRGDLPAIDRNWSGFAEEQETEPAAPRRGEAAELLPESQRRDGFAAAAGRLVPGGGRPPLVFVHSPFPHAPWQLLPDGRRYRLWRDEYPGGSQAWPRRQWLADRGFQRHVLQTQYVDRRLGVLLERLRTTGLYERAAIVVVADHGAAFRAGEKRRRPTPGNLADIANVPLLVKLPGQRSGRIDDGAVRTIDVLPTIAAAAGADPGAGLDGIPADRRPDDPAAVVDVLDGRTDEPIRRPLSVIVAQRTARDRYEARLLRRGIWAVGPRPGALGDPASGAAAPEGVGATVDGRAAFADVDPQAPTLPAYVSGTVEGVPPDGVLAIAVNGRIEATTRVEPRRGDDQYAAMVRPASLRPGRNAVRVLWLAAGGPVVLG